MSGVSVFFHSKEWEKGMYSSLFGVGLQRIYLFEIRSLSVKLLIRAQNKLIVFLFQVKNRRWDWLGWGGGMGRKCRQL